ncbi:hypothetical protein PIB30_043912 [Stylosanthes scabra]|uniref:Uncharacterized protein n=1 Tax=Stylosanthes scabra TaxID=79078 RepID=A0ABU6UEZ9_9FABA|nr:hypothetical protein [Stylosanthes scabra]
MARKTASPHLKESTLEFFLDTFRKHERSSGWLRFLAVEPAAVEAEPLVSVFASHPESANKTK